MWSLHICIILALMTNDLLKKSQNLYIDKRKQAPKKNFKMEKTRKFMWDLADLINYISFHWCNWFGYYVVVIALLLTYTTIVNLIILISIMFLFGRNIWLSRDQRFSGMSQMRNPWIFNRLLCIAIFAIRYTFLFAKFKYIDIGLIHELKDFIFTRNLSWLGVFPNNENFVAV